MPGPQTAALTSPADEVFFGGAAGGGKSFLLLGLALTRHKNSIIFRREFPQLRELIDRSHDLIGTDRGRFNGQANVWRLNDSRVLEFGAVQHERDKGKYQGRPHDLIAFDELPHFTRSQYRFLIGWNRSSDPAQRCRVVSTGNPPTSADERWVIEEWAPWLDPKHPDPARAGELRWYTADADRLVWLKTGEPFTRDGETVRPRSRTFIPARLEDNPILAATNYRSVLQALPEPLRSQLLKGDFTAGAEDSPWQVIPTAWVEAAMARWQPHRADGSPLTTLGVDVAYGGDDKTVLSRRYRTWFARLEKHPGRSTPDGHATASLILKSLTVDTRDPRDQRATVNIDAIGYGASAFDLVKGKLPRAVGVVFSNSCGRADRTGVLHFLNLRAYAWWSMREALDPASGDNLSLPPDPELLADLTAPHWSISAGGIKVESKPDIKERLGRSPDCGDAVVLANLILVMPTTGGAKPVGTGAPRI